MHETAYLMLENIRKIGYDPKDIKLILLSHAHCDHIGAARTMKELTGARSIWASVTGSPDRAQGSHLQRRTLHLRRFHAR